jgi:hypothetical protein
LSENKFLNFSVLLISFLFPKYFCFLSLIAFKKKDCDMLFCEMALIAFFLLNISVWAFFYEKCSIFIFLYSFLVILFVYFSIKLFLIYGLYLKKACYSLWLILLHLWIYKIGGLIFFGENYVFPIYYPLFQFGIFSEILGSYFFKYSPLILFVFIAINSNFYEKYKKIIIFILIFLQISFIYINSKNNVENEINFIEKIKIIFPCEFDLFENKIKGENYSIKNDEIFVFPESSIEVFSYDDIFKIKNFAILNKCNLFIGLVHKKNKLNSFCEKHGVLKIDKNGKIYWREKNYVFPFIEKIKIFEKNKNFENLNFEENVFICSEILLHEFYHKKNIKNKKTICLISDRWTNTIFTFWFKNIIKCCMNIHKKLFK